MGLLQGYHDHYASPTTRSIHCGGQCCRHGMKMNCAIGCATRRYSICFRVFPSSSLVSDMVHPKSTTVSLEGPLFWECRLHDHWRLSRWGVLCKCAGKQMSSLNWCGFQYFTWCFMSSRRVYMTWYFSFPREDTLRGLMYVPERRIPQVLVLVLVKICVAV